jgi:hypothetical protein
MRRFLIAGAATVVLSLGFSTPALAGSNPVSSCSGLAASSIAGQPRAEAEVQFGVQGDAADEGVAPGIVESDFSKLHLGSSESCLA